MTATPAIAVRLRRESATAPVTQLSSRTLLRRLQAEESSILQWAIHR